MENNKKKEEELQSRREFFKKVGKGVLPILGAAVLANLPIQQAEAVGCGGYSCSYSCGYGCATGCSSSCKTTCSGGSNAHRRYFSGPTENE